MVKKYKKKDFATHFVAFSYKKQYLCGVKIKEQVTK